jgi:hypothetical protein
MKLLTSNLNSINEGKTVSWRYLDIRVVAMKRDCEDERNEGKSLYKPFFVVT